MTTAFDPVGKLLRHPYEVVSILNTTNWKAAPVGVEISPTNDCNAKCPWCFYVSSSYKKHHSAESLPFDLMEHLVNSLWRVGVKSVTWTGGGEPSMYEQMDASIDMFRQVGIRQGMFTNGYRRLDSAKYLDWIRITITEKFMLTKNVKHYVDQGVDVGVNFNVTNENQREIRRLLDEAISLGVKYFQVRPALADTYDQQELVQFPEWILQYGDRVEVTPYKWRDYRKPHGYSVCLGHRLVPFVWHDGTVSVCAYHNQEPEFSFGNLKEETWEQIWTGPRRERMIADGVGVVKSCQHCCKLHELNKALYHEPKHVDFL